MPKTQSYFAGTIPVASGMASSSATLVNAESDSQANTLEVALSTGDSCGVETKRPPPCAIATSAIEFKASRFALADPKNKALADGFTLDIKENT
jgi:hypothetical protein